MKMILIILITLICFKSNSQIFKAEAYACGFSDLSKKDNLVPSECSILLVYDSKQQHVYIYKNPEEKYELIALVKCENSKKDTTIKFCTYKGIDETNTKCQVILGMSRTGLERLTITYLNSCYIYISNPLD